MKLIMLGTGNALVTECYNTCFLLDDGGKLFLVDGGGGNTILHQLKHAGYDWQDVKEIFVTHQHVDHLLGVLWMVRMICHFMNDGKYQGEVNVYGHREVLDLLRDMAVKLLLNKYTRFLDDRVHFIPVADGEQRRVNGRQVTFFDIGSTKTKQFGFRLELDGGKSLVCCGDEPYTEREEPYARGCTWLLHEAFCLEEEAAVFYPYEKHHSTVKHACQAAEKLGVQNVLLYHTEDNQLERRKELYTQEGKKFFSGRVYVPEDLEVLEL
ncbi:MBL fold metallo-hydrolase [Acidaminococcus sp. NSJ-142]|jgi:ribonuclease Z|uniref:MBL fold metallo-hydrolase n=1 Tax=Acidaminococcus TaxID=904 RepID=UPI001E306F94|nr:MULTISPECIES: MBL fold metallo-hydrolase [Acidaminococcus]MCD2434976.1 MBL fold metallo-hydrolase [Acidaminococcus hominis]MCH4096217.1 MBL fold metallo-hydrolase [Acidaminococcus provencensis]